MKKAKQPVPPPEAFFDLDGKQLVKTVHQRHEHQTTATKGSPPPKKGTRELVDITSLVDEDSTSSSDNKGLLTHSNQGVDGKSPASSAEEGQEECRADGR